MAEEKDLKQPQEVVAEKAREIWLAGLGVFSTIEEEGTKLFNRFVEKGKDMEKKGEEIQKKAKDKVTSLGTIDDISKFFEDKLNAVFDSLGVSSSSDVKDLSEKVDKLTATVNNLSKKLEDSSKVPTTHRTGA